MTIDPIEKINDILSRAEREGDEYFAGRPDRLHERQRFERAGNTWKLTLLYP
jgi:pyridoxine/pyridoxamine 5'-phosphate oxidase